MKCFTALLGGFALQAAAFPFVMEEHMKVNSERRQVGLPSTAEGQAISAARDNCGPIPCLTFDAAEQYVSTSGANAYASPAVDEIRGPCPGLNAAANHGYLPRSGVATIAETIQGLGAAYGLGPDANAFLAAYAIIFTGDPVLGTWSIGGPTISSNPLLGTAQGLSWSHNTYEGDSSIGRNDAYLNHGDAHSLNVTRFATAYSVGLDNDRYTLDKFAKHFEENADQSVANNPYYFAAPFSTTIVSPAAYNFVINLMSNRTAQEPGGYLDGNMFKQFFAVTGTYPNFKWQKGQERIPDNWYRRPSLEQYNVHSVGGDLAINWLAYPNSFRLGGNTNGVNSYAGIDLGDLTGGAYNLNNLLSGYKDGNSMACFMAELVQAVIPDAASTPLQLLQPITNLVNSAIKPLGVNLDCPAIDAFDQTLFNRYPGHTYSPTGPATNY